MRAGELCTRVVVTADPDESVVAAAMRMADEHVGDLVVVEQRGGRTRPVGVVTDRDIVLKVVARHQSPDAVRVAEVMTREPLLANEVDDVALVFELVKVHGVRRVPVVDREGGLVGILTLDDLTEWTAEQLGTIVGAAHQNDRRERGLRS